LLPSSGSKSNPRKQKAELIVLKYLTTGNLSQEDHVTLTKQKCHRCNFVIYSGHVRCYVTDTHEGVVCCTCR
jgi:hypothetical protein